MSKVYQAQIFSSLPLHVLSKPPLPAGLPPQHCKAAQQEASKTPVNLFARAISLRLWGWRKICEKRGEQDGRGERLCFFIGVSHTTPSAASYPDTEPRMLRCCLSETVWLVARNPKVMLPAYEMERITATLIFNVGAASFDLHGSTENPHNPTSMGFQLLGDSRPFSTSQWRNRPLRSRSRPEKAIPPQQTTFCSSL